MRNETVTIEGPRDFELDRDRDHPLVYTVTWPDSGPAPGLTLVIGGCGGEGETAEGKCRNAREYIVAHTGMIAVSVDYHCFQTRTWNGGSVHIEPREHFALVGMAAAAGLPIGNPSDINALTKTLGQSGERIAAYAKIKPGRGEYQNFGVLQAMDHLTVLGHMMERGAAFDATQIFACGGSHGGYVAHMIGKMAPGVLAGIVDNSGYTQPPISYLGMGAHAEYQAAYNGVTLLCHVENGWSFSHRRDRNFYDRNRDLIRDVAYPRHLRIMAEASDGGAMGVSMVNCAVDDISFPDDKQRQADRLNAVGVTTRLQIVQRDDIDGEIFREFTHSLAASHKRYFVRDLAWLRDANSRGTGRWGGSIEYPCVDVGYRFSLTDQTPFVTGETFELS